MIIMSVDLGKTRTGLALCDKDETISFPVCTITEKNFEKLASKIKEIIIEKNVELLVLGLPKNMNGSIGESAQNAINFKNMMESIIDIEIVLWDERRTTISAHNYLNEINVRGKKRKSIIDTLSASIILENYLNYRKSTKDFHNSI